MTGHLLRSPQLVAHRVGDVSKSAPQEALRNLDSAFSHFFRRWKLKQAGQYKGKLGYPQFKSKKKGLGSFRLTGSLMIFPKAIPLPRLGRLRLKEKNSPFDQGCQDPFGYCF